MYSIFETIVLGVVQGLTEFIPVSSSGHLVVTQFFFSGASNHMFIQFIDIGTTLALYIYFRKKIWSIACDLFINKKIALLRNILITALPAGIIGYTMSDFISSSWFFGSLVVVTITIGSVGILMVLLEKLPKAKPVDSDKLSPTRAFIIGAVQTLALIPGVSRSGSTIIAGRLSGLSAAAAAEYSFLAALPIMTGLMLKLFLGGDERVYLMNNLTLVTVSNIFSFIAGVLAIGFMIRYLSKHSLALFGWYRIGLATILAGVILLQ